MRFDFVEPEEQAPVDRDAQRIERGQAGRAPRPRAGRRARASRRRARWSARRARRRGPSPRGGGHRRCAGAAGRRAGRGWSRRRGKPQPARTVRMQRLGDVVAGRDLGQQDHAAMIASSPGIPSRHSPACFPDLPPVTKALLIANGIAFLLQLMLRDTMAPFELWPIGAGAYDPYGYMPSFLPWQLVTLRVPARSVEPVPPAVQHAGAGDVRCAARIHVGQPPLRHVLLHLRGRRGAVPARGGLVDYERRGIRRRPRSVRRAACSACCSRTGCCSPTSA